MNQINLEEISTLIYSGRQADAAERLRALTSSRIPREDAASLANYWRLAGGSNQAVRILAKYVRPAPRALHQRLPDATTRERGVYAAALLDMGSTTEAMSLLSKIPPRVGGASAKRRPVLPRNRTYGSRIRLFRKA